MKSILLALLFSLVVFSAIAEETPWPRTYESGRLTITMYAPDVTSVSGLVVKGRGAFAVTRSDQSMVFGAVSFTATFAKGTTSDLTLSDFAVEGLRLPDSLMEHQDTVAQLITDAVMSWQIVTTEKALKQAADGNVGDGLASTDLKNEAPDILVRERPSLLVVLDGKPSLKDIDKSTYQYVENSVIPIVLDKATQTYYLPNGKDWYATKDLKGAWSMTSSVPSELKEMIKMDGKDTTKTRPNLEIVVVEKPSELIAFEGAPSWKPLVGTELLYASNTESTVLQDVTAGKTYVLISGRWFRASSLTGKWSFVEPTSLPESFAKIPETSPQASARAAVAGTPEAEEAVLDAYVPTAAAVDRSKASLTVKYDGDPWFQAISGTSMEYAVNTTTPVIKTGGRFYAVDAGVWYTSSSATGPWAVSDHRPEEVDNIPSSSSVSNVKYVYVYSSTPTVVYVGYTPGYYGTYVYGPTVVYGTGWYYNPWYGPHYYPRPVTYGYSVHYSPYYGWGFGYSYNSGCFHMSVGYRPPYYGHYHPAYYRPPYYHPPAYRPPAYRPPAYRPPTGGTRPPANRPMNSAATRPSTRPSTQPSTRPSTQPSSRPSYQPSARPSTYNKPSTSNRVPSGSMQHPTARTSNQSAMRPTSSGTTRSAPRGGGGGGRRR